MLDDEKPIEQFLTLKEWMEVAFLVFDDTRSRCAGLGIIDKCSPRGIWCRFCVPHNFFIMVNITKVNTKYNGQTAYCDEETITTLGAVINCRVLWSGYKVRPTEPLGPPLNAVVKEEGMGSPPIRLQLDKVDNDFNGSDIEGTHSYDEFGGHGVGAKEKVDKEDTEFESVYPN